MVSRYLILETSHRIGTVALAVDGAIVAERRLDEARRHARDLVPAIQELLRGQSWSARELDGVVVSSGPGSYTGLRVGLMSAKTLAYATGCALLAVPTFEAIREQAPGAGPNVDVIADAQQNHVYVQRFGTNPEPLMILPLEMWLESALAWNVAVTGPGLETLADRMPPGLAMLPEAYWHAKPAGLLGVSLPRIQLGERDDPFAVEPLYLRVSSAEEKWAQLHPRPAQQAIQTG
ncbi:MAG: tRNA (adenosine(37)-N6)-threonylcarbamoyltransferase complex dimerization subunit type 1 TsaB [Planctomycetes bacterium]|nr:tRNA (adenosine(37)-N6)-threonylcarbamoyltransferase complex dimerization subunit type 1 TsaB [Planctomycetota bacterium]